MVGALSARDLLQLRAGEAVSLDDEIDQAEDTHVLAIAWAKLPHVAAALLAEGLAARDIAAVISREVGALTRQAAVLAERRLRRRWQRYPPCPYALAVLGSAGRGESLLAMDQDNALFFAQGEPGGTEDRWFEALEGVSPTSCMRPAYRIAGAASWRRTPSGEDRFPPGRRGSTIG